VSSVTRKLSKCGNSTAIVVPPILLEQLGWKAGETELELSIEGDKLTVQPEKPPTFKLFGGKTTE